VNSTTVSLRRRLNVSGSSRKSRCPTPDIDLAGPAVGSTETLMTLLVLVALVVIWGRPATEHGRYAGRPASLRGRHARRGARAGHRSLAAVPRVARPARSARRRTSGICGPGRPHRRSRSHGSLDPGYLPRVSGKSRIRACLAVARAKSRPGSAHGHPARTRLLGTSSRRGLEVRYRRTTSRLRLRGTSSPRASW
jgi:hypothetical protein